MPDQETLRFIKGHERHDFVWTLVPRHKKVIISGRRDAKLSYSIFSGVLSSSFEDVVRLRDMLLAWLCGDALLQLNYEITSNVRLSIRIIELCVSNMA